MSRESLLFNLRHPVTRCEPLSDFRTAPCLPEDASYQDRMAEIRRQLTLDNYVWARDQLSLLLERYPWQFEAAELFGWLETRLVHLRSQRAYLRHCLWRSSQFRESDVAQLDPMVDRVVAVRGHIDAYLAEADIQDALLVDVAMGQGDTTWQYADLPRVGRVIGVDASPAHVNAAHAHFAHPKLSPILALGEKLPLKWSADVVVLSAVLEHCIEPFDLLVAAGSAAKPDGLIVLQVPYGGFEWNTPSAPQRTIFDHVRTFDIAAYLETRKSPLLHFIDYSNDPNLPWSWYDTVGDFVGSFLN